MAQMAYAPYDMVHVASYSGEGCSLDVVRQFVSECWYYEDELVLAEQVKMGSQKAQVEIYFDEYYYYLNVYLEDEEAAYHIYAVVDTLPEAEFYAKYIEETLTV